MERRRCSSRVAAPTLADFCAGRPGNPALHNPGRSTQASVMEPQATSPRPPAGLLCRRHAGSESGQHKSWRRDTPSLPAPASFSRPPAQRSRRRDAPNLGSIRAFATSRASVAPATLMVRLAALSSGRDTLDGRDRPRRGAAGRTAMAVYLLTVRTISRGRAGGNMLAAAAYRSGSRLVERDGWDPGSVVAAAAHAAGERLADHG